MRVDCKLILKYIRINCVTLISFVAKFFFSFVATNATHIDVSVPLTKIWTSIKLKHARPLLYHVRDIKDFYLRILSHLSVKNRIAWPLACAAVMKFTRVYIVARLFVHSTRNSSFQRIICRIIYGICTIVVNNAVMFICRSRSIHFSKI